MRIPYAVRAGETDSSAELDVAGTGPEPKSYSAPAIVDVMERVFCRATLQGQQTATFETSGQTPDDTIGQTVITVTTATDVIRIGPAAFAPDAVAEAVRLWNAAIEAS